MGFLSFFKHIGSGIKKGFHSIGTGLKKAGNWTLNKVFKPGFNKIIKPVFNKVVKPATKKAVSFVNHGVDRVERIADAGTKGIESAGGLLGTISKSPMLIIGIIAIGAFVAIKK